MKLEARDISFRYGEGERQVLAHVDLTVESGERVGIMAPSGFGKTTLLKILAGYERPESGEVLLDGTPLERFRGYVPVQMIWQHPELSVNPARRLKTVLAEGDWPEDGGVMRGRIEKEMGLIQKPSGPVCLLEGRAHILFRTRRRPWKKPCPGNAPCGR